MSTLSLEIAQNNLQEYVYYTGNISRQTRNCYLATQGEKILLVFKRENFFSLLFQRAFNYLLGISLDKTKVTKLYDRSVYSVDIVNSRFLSAADQCGIYPAAKKCSKLARHLGGELKRIANFAAIIGAFGSLIGGGVGAGIGLASYNCRADALEYTESMGVRGFISGGVVGLIAGAAIQILH